jgi:hypothetical protein
MHGRSVRSRAVLRRLTSLKNPSDWPLSKPDTTPCRRGGLQEWRQFSIANLVGRNVPERIGVRFRPSA